MKTAAHALKRASTCIGQAIGLLDDEAKEDEKLVACCEVLIRGIEEKVSSLSCIIYDYKQRKKHDDYLLRKLNPKT